MDESADEEMMGVIDNAYGELADSHSDESDTNLDSNTKSESESEHESPGEDEGETKADESDKSVSEDESLDPSDNDDENIDEMISSTFKYTILHDKDEIEDLLNQLKIYLDSDCLQILKQLDEMVKLYYDSEYILKDPILPLLEGLIEKLVACGSITAKGKLIQLKMLLKDITINRDRISEVFKALNEPEDVEKSLKVLWIKNFLSNDQYKMLLNTKFDLSDVKAMLTKTKYGRGEKFLPRRSKEIYEKLHSLVNSNTNNDKQILAMVDELYERGCFTDEQYREIKKVE